jgi:hypothetical protein
MNSLAAEVEAVLLRCWQEQCTPFRWAHLTLEVLSPIGGGMS